jgi:uncharacterized protein YbjT (DUF2867 family)
VAPILVTGATGRVGSAVVRRFAATDLEVRAATRGPAGAAGPGERVRFDFTAADTWAAAFRGVEVVFVVRPPHLGNVRRDVLPALRAARAAGARHVVLLSVQGADRLPVLPHAVLERWLRRSGLGWTFVRAAYFMQNLTTVHGADIRDRASIVVPAGTGRTAFVDVDDVAAVAATALADPDRHDRCAWTPTGPSALDYAEVAEVLSGVLGRPVRYTRPGVGQYWRHTRRELGWDRGLSAVTSAVYTAARFGMAAGVTDDVRAVTGRAATPLAEFAQRERGAWV